MHQGEHTSPYNHYATYPTSNTNPHPPNQSPAPYASAPPFSTTGYTPSDYAGSYSSYPPYPQNPDPAPAPTAPSYAAPPNPSPNLPPPTYNQSIQQPLPPSSLPAFDSHTAYQPPAQQQPQPYYSAPPGSYDQPAQVPPAYSAPPASYDQPPQVSPVYSAPPASYDQPPQVPSAYSAPISASSNVNPNMMHGTNPPYSSTYTSSAPFNPPAYESSYSNSMKYDQGGSGYFDDKYGSDGRSQSSLSSDVYGKQSNASLYGSGGDDSYGDGVYAYQGGKKEPYGSRGTAPKSSTWGAFDDYGRSISLPSVKESSSVSSPKIVRAVPKADTQQDIKSGVQKFRVKLLPESGPQGTMDVLCQIGLDGIKMLDPSTGRTLRIYPLETITRCEVTDSSTLSFWSKSSVDIEARRIRLQSNSYTTNTLLDIVTAATVQVKEMSGRIRQPDTSKINEQAAEKKKGFGDWMNKIKPGNEEKDHWVPDEAVTKCTSCGTDFNAFVRKHHCRNCGDIFCDKCTHGRIALTAEEDAPQVRVCDRCLAEVTQRLSNAKEAANKPAVQSHDDLARKLQEEMEKNRKSASGSRSEGSGWRMREVSCPTCTVHLQVQVPASGSETIECGVCQHPFLVSAH